MQSATVKYYVNVDGGRLWRMQVRLWRSVGSLQYFTSNQWSFDMSNVVNLLSRMCAEDRQVV